jgi:hypothetical protein
MRYLLRLAPWFSFAGSTNPRFFVYDWPAPRVFRAVNSEELFEREPHLLPPRVDAKEELAVEIGADALSLNGPGKVSLGELGSEKAIASTPIPIACEQVVKRRECLGLMEHDILEEPSKLLISATMHRSKRPDGV